MSFPALQLRIVNSDGSYGRPLTERTGLTLNLTDGEPNALAFSYNARAPEAALLADLLTVVVLIGGLEYQDMRFVLDDTGRDEVVEEDTVSWSALSILGQLAYGIVLPEGYDPAVAGVQFGVTNPGRTLRVLLERCQSRGALTWVTLDFNDQYDSSGAAWPVMDSEFVDAGTNLLDYLENLCDRRLASARMQGTTLRLFAYGNQGVDRSQDAKGMLLRGRDLIDGPWNSTSRDARSVMWALGDIPDTSTGSGDDASSKSKPILISETNQSAKDRFGVREAWLSQQQVDSESQLHAIASGSLALTNRARDAYSYKLAMQDGPLPVVDWTKGDMMQIRTAGGARQMRARQITLNEGDDGLVGGSAGFGDRAMDADDELERALARLQQLTGSSADGGLYGSPKVTYDKLSDSAAVDTVRVKKNDLTQAQWDVLIGLGYRGLIGDDDEANNPSMYVPRNVLVAVKAGQQLSTTGGTDLVRVTADQLTSEQWQQLIELGYQLISADGVEALYVPRGCPNGQSQSQPSRKSASTGPNHRIRSGISWGATPPRN